MRLRGYDYSQAGAYFVTCCTNMHRCALGTVTEGRVELSRAGAVAASVWESLPDHFRGVELDAFVVMPNHVHGIVVLPDMSVGSGDRVTLGRVMGYYKYTSTRLINATRGTAGMPVWQRHYFDHIVRSYESLDRIRQYIENNPLRWHLDSLYSVE
jgi:REP element-mobilizing transposase RayT